MWGRQVQKCHSHSAVFTRDTPGIFFSLHSSYILCASWSCYLYKQEKFEQVWILFLFFCTQPYLFGNANAAATSTKSSFCGSWELWASHFVKTKMCHCLVFFFLLQCSREECLTKGTLETCLFQPKGWPFPVLLPLVWQFQVRKLLNKQFPSLQTVSCRLARYLEVNEAAVQCSSNQVQNCRRVCSSAEPIVPSLCVHALCA